MSGFPVAVAPSVRSPGLYLSIDLLSGASSAGAGALKGLVVACKSSAGDIAVETEIREAIAGEADASVAYGPGMPGHLGAKAAFLEFPAARIDLVCAASPAGATATGTITFTTGGVVTVARTVTIYICKKQIQIAWLPGETVTQIADKATLAINAYASELPVVASNIADVLTLTAKDPGTWGNDIRISVTTSGGLPTSAIGTASGANLTGGTLNADISTALALCAGTEYAFILVAANSNADTNSASATSQVGRALTHVNALNSGNNAKLQQVIAGSSGTLSATKTGTAQHNSEKLEVVNGASFLGLPAEIGGAEMGARLRDETIDPAVNRIQKIYIAPIGPPLSLVTGALTAPQVEDALQSGVTPITFDSSGNPRPDRPITSHFKDANGNADDRCLDVSAISGAYAFCRDLRSSIPAEFPGAKLSADLAPDDDPPPAGTVEVRDVLSFVITRALFFVQQGILDASRTKTAIANGEFLVRVNPSDPSQCDVFIPERIVAPLAKFSVVVKRAS